MMNGFKPAGANTLRPLSENVLFAGRGAANADRLALAGAQTLELFGVSPDDIWKRTGWGRGADGQWRFEIDDSAADMRPMPKAPAPWPVGEVFAHPGFAAAYPNDARDMRWTIDDKIPAGSAQYEPGDKMISMGRGAAPEGIDNGMSGFYGPRASTLHEIQHGIQGREGFASGMALNRVPDNILYEEYRALTPQEMRDDPARAARNARWRAYARNRGEVEARNVQIRRGLSADERLQLPPWKTEDIPRDKQY